MTKYILSKLTYKGKEILLVNNKKVKSITWNGNEYTFKEPDPLDAQILGTWKYTASTIYGGPGAISAVNVMFESNNEIFTKISCKATGGWLSAQNLSYDKKQVAVFKVFSTKFTIQAYDTIKILNVNKIKNKQAFLDWLKKTWTKQ